MTETVLAIVAIALAVAWLLEKMRVRYYREKLASLKTIALSLADKNDLLSSQLHESSKDIDSLQDQLRVFGGKF